jgi:TonB family protein
MDSCEAIPQHDARNSLLRTLFLCAMAGTAVLAGAQQKPSDPVSQNSPEPPPAGSTSAHPPDATSCVLIRAVNPTFAPQASPKKKRGRIVLHVTVAADGIVKDVTVVSGDPVLVGPAMDAVRQYQFAPCMQEGSPIESQTNITVTYDLRRGASYPADASSAVPREPQEDVIREIEHRELFQLRDGVTFPKALVHVNPEYSDAARKANLQGGVVLGVVVGIDGKPRSLWVAQTLGEGLDENAIEAVKRWIFEPATKEGKPVPILISLVLDFRR